MRRSWGFPLLASFGTFVAGCPTFVEDDYTIEPSGAGSAGPTADGSTGGTGGVIAAGGVGASAGSSFGGTASGGSAGAAGGAAGTMPRGGSGGLASGGAAGVASGGGPAGDAGASASAGNAGAATAGTAGAPMGGTSGAAGAGAAAGTGGASGGGGSGATGPGLVSCESDICDLGADELCCMRTPGSPSCIGSGDSCSCGLCISTEITCDGPGDCPPGDVCCADISEFRCRADCSNGMEICQVGDGIPCRNGGPCEQQSLLPPGYRGCR